MSIPQGVMVEWACERLCRAFAYHLDHGEFDALSALFTAEGVFHRNGEVLAGRQAIRGAYALRPMVTTVHLVTNFHLIELGEGQVQASVLSLVLHASEAGESASHFEPRAGIRLLEFDDRFQLTADGWRFAVRKARPVLAAPDWPGAPWARTAGRS